ncbi:MAG TPA: hypothetical protein VIY90_14770 [Steroidobacteraceae bacterium]
MKLVQKGHGNILGRFCVCATVALGCVAADSACRAAVTPAPLLDRGAFFTEPEIIGAQVSPDGKFLAFLKPGAVQNIWLKRTNQPLAAAQPVTAGDDHSAEAFYWSRDSRYLLFTRDAGGRGKSDLFAVDVNSVGGIAGAPKRETSRTPRERLPKCWPCRKRRQNGCMSP